MQGSEEQSSVPADGGSAARSPWDPHSGSFMQRMYSMMHTEKKLASHAPQMCSNGTGASSLWYRAGPSHGLETLPIDTGFSHFVKLICSVPVIATDTVLSLILPLILYYLYYCYLFWRCLFHVQWCCCNPAAATADMCSQDSPKLLCAL